MNILTLLILLLWFACGVLVVRFVWRTGGYSKLGHIAHWFGGVFVMLGLAVGLIWGFSHIDADFGVHANVYVLTHQLRSDKKALIEQHTTDNQVTVYRPGSVNTVARMDGRRLIINESKTTRTSLWWMLWDTKYTSSNE